MVNRALVLATLCLVACQGKDDAASGRAAQAKRDAAKPDTAPLAEDAAREPDGSAALAPASATKPDESAEPTPDPGKTIDDLGGVSAWQAVVDRAQYLARRGQSGVVFGTLGAPIEVADPTTDGGLVATPYTWLVDDTEGNGALAIRVMLGKHDVAQGQRVALAGAWVLDETLRYYWKVDQVTPLPPAPPTDLEEPPAAPGHEIVDGGFPPGGHMIKFAKDGDAVIFTVVGKPPAVDGDGWQVASELGDPVFALLNLPGERPSFGAQDFRTPDERWHLKRGQQYWVRIGKIRRGKDPLKPANINARTAPVHIK
jgi:hypothetical protein